MSSKSPPLSLIYLEWLDAGVITQGDWLSYEEVLEAAKPESYINKTVGWLLREDNTVIVVAAQVAVDHKEPRYDLVMMIPKALIRKRKCLKI